MRKLFTALVLVPLFFSCDEYEITSVQEQSFIKFFGGGLEDEGMKVLTTEKGYLVMGNIKNGTNQDICVIRTDKFGNAIAPIAAYGGEYDDYGYAIEPTPPNGYIIAGSTVSEYNDRDIFLVQIDTLGNTLWTKILGHSYDDEAFDVLVLDNGNLVFTGYTEISETNKDYFLYESNANGDSLRFSSDGTARKSEVILSIVESNSSYLMAGYSYTSELDRNVFAIIWRGSGSAEQTFTNSIGLKSQVSAICSASSNEYYLACTVQPGQSSNSQIYIIKVNSELDIVWQKSYGEQALNSASDIAIYDNSILITGTSTNLAGTYSDDDILGDMLILETNLSGENTEYLYMGDGVSYRGKSLDHTPDGGYIITGANHINNINSVITLCKLTAEGALE